ncbi:hypothetical protein SAMN05443252_102622 [Bacillus sp. OV322]|nr:hypothetical protein SAMN05443252_102622 [Bacillus sp. OV322]
MNHSIAANIIVCRNGHEQENDPQFCRMGIYTGLSL